MVVRKLWLAFVGTLSVAACATPSDQELLNRAVVDSAVRRPAMHVALTPIAGDTVRAVSWMPADRIPPDGSELTRHTWITLHGQLKERCATFPREGLQLRIEQLLGLAPGWGQGRKIVEFEVPRQFVFRPCTDPSVTTTSCPPTAPWTPPAGWTQAQFDTDLSWIAHQLFETHRIGYAGATGVPFTGLGYTYDWHPGNASHVGLSEYVVRGGAKISNRLDPQDIEAYCAAPKPN